MRYKANGSADNVWLQKLMSLGPLRAAWRPGDAVCVVRAVVRQREVLLTEQASWVQHMEETLVQRNAPRFSAMSWV